MRKVFGIPINEVPILIIGIGCLEDRFRVAVSNRKAVEATNKYH